MGTILYCYACDINRISLYSIHILLIVWQLSVNLIKILCVLQGNNGRHYGLPSRFVQACSFAGIILIFRFLTIWSCTCRSCCQRFDPLFDPFCIWVNELSMNINQVKKLRKIVRIKKLARNNSNIFVCTMKKTSFNYRMVLTLLPCFYPLRHFKIYNSDLCTSLFSVLFTAVHRWLPLKPPAWSRGEEGIHWTPMVQYWSLPEEDKGWAGNYP